jgi:hypothetical protein
LHLFLPKIIISNDYLILTWQNCWQVFIVGAVVKTFSFRLSRIYLSFPVNTNYNRELKSRSLSRFAEQKCDYLCTYNEINYSSLLRTRLFIMVKVKALLKHSTSQADRNTPVRNVLPTGAHNLVGQIPFCLQTVGFNCCVIGVTVLSRARVRDTVTAVVNFRPRLYRRETPDFRWRESRAQTLIIMSLSGVGGNPEHEPRKNEWKGVVPVRWRLSLLGRLRRRLPGIPLAFEQIQHD